MYSSAAQSASSTANSNDRLDRLASLHLKMDDELQSRCSGFVQAELDRYSEVLHGTRPERAGSADRSGSDHSESDDDERQTKKTTKEKSNKTKVTPDDGEYVPPLRHPLLTRFLDETTKKPKAFQALALELAFEETISSFTRAITFNVIEMRHATTILSRYQQFGPFFDACAKTLAETLKDEALYGGDASATAQVVVDTLREVSSTQMAGS